MSDDLAELIAQLARLPDEKRRDVTKAAGVARQRLIKAATQRVGNTLLSGWSGRQMARVIADAVHAYSGGHHDPSILTTRVPVKWAMRR